MFFAACASAVHVIKIDNKNTGTYDLLNESIRLKVILVCYTVNLINLLLFLTQSVPSLYASLPSMSDSLTISFLSLCCHMLFQNLKHKLPHPYQSPNVPKITALL
jgi:hypothetical protein